MSNGRPSVLVVDDDPSQRATIRGLVENLGYEAVAAATGAEAARVLRERGFGAVLLSVKMPEAERREVLRGLDVDGVRRTPVIGVADASSVHARSRCREAGMDECIGTPFRMKDLGALLLRCVVEGDESPEAARGPILDEETVATLRQYELLGQLVPSYVATLPAHLESLQEALAAGDRQAIRQRAHHLRSSSVQMGAAALARALGEIEGMVVGDAEGRLPAVTAELDGLVNATIDALLRASAAYS